MFKETFLVLGYEQLNITAFVWPSTENPKQASSLSFNFQNLEKPCIKLKDSKNIFSIFILKDDACSQLFKRNPVLVITERLKCCVKIAWTHYVFFWILRKPGIPMVVIQGNNCPKSNPWISFLVSHFNKVWNVRGEVGQHNRKNNENKNNYGLFHLSSSLFHIHCRFDIHFVQFVKVYLFLRL